jgi:hypothetical protein
LHSEELHEALSQVKIPAEVNNKLSSELRHTARSRGAAIPFLLVHIIEEATLLSNLVLEMPIFDENTMVIKWCNHMNGTSVFPSVQDAVNNVRSGTVLLEEVNNFHTIPGQGPISIYTVIQEAVEDATAVSTSPTEQVRLRTADPYSAQKNVAQAMAPNMCAEHSQTQESSVQYVVEASAAVDEISVLAANIETASTENSMIHADMLTTADNGALQDISSPQTFNIERHYQ